MLAREEIRKIAGRHFVPWLAPEETRMKPHAEIRKHKADTPAASFDDAFEELHRLTECVRAGMPEDEAAGLALAMDRVFDRIKELVTAQMTPEAA